jgi:uncharacterized protein YkwD
MTKQRTLSTTLGAAALAASALLVACGGSGNSSQLGGGPAFSVVSTGGGPSASPTPTPIPGPVTVTGSVVSIPVTGFGANAPQTPLGNAVVVIGPTLVTGATAPPVAPGGDVMVTTTAAGTYSATVATGPAASLSSQATYVHPPNDLSGFAPPAVGYYISVFAPGADGKSAGAPLPVHAFSGLSAGTVMTTQRVTTASIDEANFLTLVNHDRTTANGLALPMVFDENAEEAARAHVAEEAAGQFYCHYNAQNIGPGSRFLGLGAIGQDDENIGKTSGQDAPGSYTQTEAAFMSEAATNGGHYTNIIDSTHAWAGVTTLVSGPTAQFVDQEFVSPNGIAPFVYPNFAGSACPPGVQPNNS